MRELLGDFLLFPGRDLVDLEASLRVDAHVLQEIRISFCLVRSLRNCDRNIPVHESKGLPLRPL